MFLNFEESKKLEASNIILGISFPPGFLELTGRNTIFHFWTDSRSFQINGLGKIYILRAFYECFIVIDVDGLRNMIWSKRASPSNKRRLGSAKM